ncbi:MAG: hypothetical protein M5U09_24555 [Gammaproteobacteria bacterium]|nr:hypothetical protein [Gammaproteobacteria bacterium]
MVTSSRAFREYSALLKTISSAKIACGPWMTWALPVRIRVSPSGASMPSDSSTISWVDGSSPAASSTTLGISMMSGSHTSGPAKNSESSPWAAGAVASTSAPAARRKERLRGRVWIRGDSGRSGPGSRMLLCCLCEVVRNATSFVRWCTGCYALGSHCPFLDR